MDTGRVATHDQREPSRIGRRRTKSRKGPLKLCKRAVQQGRAMRVLTGWLKLGHGANSANDLSNRRRRKPSASTSRVTKSKAAEVPCVAAVRWRTPRSVRGPSRLTALSSRRYHWTFAAWIEV